MKFIKTIGLVFSLAGAAAAAFSQSVSPQKPTLAISEVEATPSLAAKIGKDGKTETFERIAQSLGDEIGTALQGSNRFQIVARGDFSKLLAEQEFTSSGNVDLTDEAAAQAGKIKGAQYLLVVTVTDFQDYTEHAKFETLGKDAEKRIIRFGVVAKRYNAENGLLFDSFSYSLSNMDTQEILKNVYRSDNSNDMLVPEISKLMAKKIADGFADRILPIRVLSVRGNMITINRGEGSEINIGDELDIFATGSRLVDPDTKEDLGVEEFYVGRARVSYMMPKYSQATLVTDNGVDVGAIARRVKKAE